MGVCLHPEYGGWFAMRCVFIFKNLTTSDLIKKEPIDRLNGDCNRIIDLISKFNLNWKDWAYRNVIKVKGTYSNLQKDYFLTEPKLRRNLLKTWLQHPNQESLYQAYKDTETQRLLQNNYLINNFYILN